MAVKYGLMVELYLNETLNAEESSCLNVFMYQYKMGYVNNLLYTTDSPVTVVLAAQALRKNMDEEITKKIHSYKLLRITDIENIP